MKVCKMKIMCFLWFLLFFGANFSTALAQTSGDFRSAGNGNWTAAGSWQTYNGATWEAATEYPGQSTGTYAVTISHTITNGSTFATPQEMGTVTISGNLSIPTGFVFTLKTSRVEVPSGGTITFNGNGSSLVLNDDATISVTTGGLTNVGACNSQRTIVIGSTTFASCNGGGATYEFSDLMSFTPPVVTTHPAPQTGCDGFTATFTAAASGDPTPSVIWQQNTGSGFSDIPGETTTTLTFTANYSQNGYLYRAVFKNFQGEVPSNQALLTVTPLPATPTNPTADPMEICPGGSSTLSATVGAGEVVDWYRVSCGDTFVATGSPTVSPGVTMTYYARARNTTTDCESASCAEITVTVKEAPECLAYPYDGVVCEGTDHTYTIEPVAGATYQWNVTAGTISSGQGTNQITWTAGGLGAETISVTVTNADGCQCLHNFEVTVNPAPAGCSITAPASVGYGETFQASTVETLSATYAWTVFVDGVNQTGNPAIVTNADSRIVTITAPNPFIEIKVGVKVTTDQGCECESDPPIDPETGAGGRSIRSPQTAGSIPTLSEWGMIIFSILMAGAAVVFLKRKENQAA